MTAVGFQDLFGVGAEQCVHDYRRPPCHHHAHRRDATEHDGAGAVRGSVAGAGERWSGEPTERGRGELRRARDEEAVGDAVCLRVPTTDAGGHAGAERGGEQCGGRSYTVAASVTGVATPTASFALTNAGGTGVTLTFTQQPVNTPAGAVIAPPVVVTCDRQHGGGPVGRGDDRADRAGRSREVLVGGNAPVATGASGTSDVLRHSASTRPGPTSCRPATALRVASSTSFVIRPRTSSGITVVAGSGRSAQP